MSTNSDYYLARADESARDAKEAKLANVRDRCLRAEAAWRAMAARLLHGERLRDAAAKKRLESETAA